MRAEAQPKEAEPGSAAALTAWPLTPIQLGILYERWSGRRGVNVEQVVCHLDDEVPDSSRMVDVWSQLAQRHEVLRCACNWRDRETPFLVCDEQTNVKLAVEHFAGLSASAREDALARWLIADRDKGVDIEASPTWRVSMLVWGERSFSLVWTFHHLFLDGPSCARLLQEALRAYMGGGEAAPLIPPAPTQADHARALERWRADPVASAGAARFFREMFEGVSLPAGETWSAMIAQPLIKASAKVEAPSERMEVHAARVPAPTLALLETLSDLTNTSMASVVQVAWGLVLARWSGHSDVIFGVVRSGRYLLPNAQHALGCLINTVPIRMSVRQGLSLVQLLGEMRQTMVALRPHEHAALTDIQQWCGMNSTMNLVGCTVLFEPRPLHRRLQETVSSRVRFELHEQGSAELTLLAYVDDGLDLRLEYDPDLIASETAVRLLDSACQLLESMAAALPITPVAALRSNGSEEVAVLHRWSTPEHPVDRALVCVATSIERQALERPDALALFCATRNEGVSYAKLNADANRLAHWLMSKGVARGDYIALCMPRGVNFVVSMLAVMKSGAAWVPVDPAYPSDLMIHMVSDSGARLLLTEQSVRPVIDAVEVVALEEIASELSASAVHATASVWTVDRPAYVIYTSGTSGKPKGVVVGHHALACHAQSIIQSYGLRTEDRALQFASLSFDVSIEEIVPTLVVGAGLVLRHAAAAESVSALLRLIADRDLTVLNLPTAFWHTCVEQMTLSDAVLPESVRLLIVGGEKASRGILEQWRRLQPRLNWINAYGPTETTISCAYFPLPSECPLPTGPDVPIGRPLGHARAVVLAVDGSLSPPGGRGELCIGGPGLADGYIGLEAATAERFVTAGPDLDPLLETWGLTRIYRTGDATQWDGLGQLRFLGRRDRQVKVRGYRVELHAIEHAVEQLDGVAECITLVDRPDEPQARLLAWVLPRHGASLTEPDLEAALALALPSHMCPAIRLVSSWPTTPGGKIDVQHLPLHGLEVQVAPPLADEPEDIQRIAALFARILGLERVGRDESFFDLGGNSLLAIGLIAAIERELGYKLSVGTLKARLTPARLAAVLAEESGLDKPQFLVAIQPGERGIPIYGVHSLGHRERFYRPLARRLGPDQSLFGLTTGYTHLHDNTLSIEQLARLYFDDIQKHRPEGPLVLAAVSMSAYVAYELAKQLVEEGRQVVSLVLFDSEGPGGRPFLRNKAKVLSLHWSQLKEIGPRYILERVAARLTNAEYRNGLGSRMGHWLAQRLGMPPSKPFDHPADHIFINNLALAVSRYTPHGYRGDMLILYPGNEPFFDLSEALRTGLGWRDCSKGAIGLHAVPGGHVSMLEEPHVGVIAQRLAGILSDWKDGPTQVPSAAQLDFATAIRPRSES